MAPISDSTSLRPANRWMVKKEIAGEHTYAQAAVTRLHSQHANVALELRSPCHQFAHHHADYPILLPGLLRIIE